MLPLSSTSTPTSTASAAALLPNINTSTVLNTPSNPSSPLRPNTDFPCHSHTHGHAHPHSAHARLSSQSHSHSRSPLSTVEQCSSFTVTLPNALPGNEGSFSLSPSGRDVVLTSQEGLILLDLLHPLEDTEQLFYTLPPIHWNKQISCQSKVQWNPHVLKDHCIASTKWNHIYIWSLHSSSTVLSASSSALPPSSSSSFSTFSSSTSSTPMTSPPSSPLPKTDSPNIFSSTYFQSKLRVGSFVEHILHGHTRSVTDIDWSPFQPDLLASCSLDSTIVLWDLRKPKKHVNSFSTWTDAINLVRWNPNNIWLFASAHNNEVWIWDIRKGASPTYRIQEHTKRVSSLDWHPFNEQELLSASFDGNVCWWNLVKSQKQHACIDSGFPVWKAKFAPMALGIVVLSYRPTDPVKIYNAQDLQTSLSMALGPITHVDWRTCPRHFAPELQLMTYGTERKFSVTPLVTDQWHWRMYDAGAGGEPVPRGKEVLRTFFAKDALAAPVSPAGATPPPLTLSSASPSAARNLLVLPPPLRPAFTTWLTPFRIPPEYIDPKEPAAPILKNLKQELLWVASRYNNIKFDRVDMASRICGFVLQGPWGVDHAFIPIKVSMQFPERYPDHVGPTVHLLDVPSPVKETLHQELMQVIDRNVSRNRICLEACLRVLLGPTEPKPDRPSEVDTSDVESDHEIIAETTNRNFDPYIPFPRLMSIAFSWHQLVVFTSPFPKDLWIPRSYDQFPAYKSRAISWVSLPRNSRNIHEQYSDSEEESDEMILPLDSVRSLTEVEEAKKHQKEVGSEERAQTQEKPSKLESAGQKEGEVSPDVTVAATPSESTQAPPVLFSDANETLHHNRTDLGRHKRNNALTYIPTSASSLLWAPSTTSPSSTQVPAAGTTKVVASAEATSAILAGAVPGINTNTATTSSTSTSLGNIYGQASAEKYKTKFNLASNPSQLSNTSISHLLLLNVAPWGCFDPCLALGYTLNGSREELCQHNAKVARHGGYPVIEKCWLMVELCLAQPSVSLFSIFVTPMLRSFEWNKDWMHLALFSFLLHQSNTALLSALAPAGTRVFQLVQLRTPATKVGTTWSIPYLKPAMQMYLDLLLRAQLFETYLRTLKHARRHGLELMDLSVHALVSSRVHCGMCHYEGKGGWLTGEHPLRCSLCRLPVLKQGLFCPFCGHGGHFTHIHEWYKYGNTMCPARGCDCFCFL